MSILTESVAVLVLSYIILGLILTIYYVCLTDNFIEKLKKRALGKWYWGVIIMWFYIVIMPFIVLKHITFKIFRRK